MRKDEHLKIVKEFEDELNKLQQRINELKIESTKYEFDAKLHLFVSEQRREMINEMMEKGLKNMNYMAQYDSKVKDFQKEVINRITLDDEKFKSLKNFIQTVFPSAIMEQKNFPIQTNIDDENLSNTFVGEDGEIYTPQHVVDIAILIMKKQNEKLKEILGEDDDYDLGSNED